MVRSSIFSLVGAAAMCCTAIAAFSSSTLGATGVCCIPGLTCAIADSTICAGAGGLYKGDNTTCSPTNPCELPRGACCIAQSALTPPPYTGGGGPATICFTWLNFPRPTSNGFTGTGLGGLCLPFCCRPKELPAPELTGGPFNFGDAVIICAVLTEGGCTTNGGVYHGDNSPCTPILCAPPSTLLGACCRVPVGSAPICTSTTQTQCGEGTWTVSQTCATTPCNPPTGACCRTDYCVVLTSGACDATHAIYKGDGTVCNTTTCPPPVLGTCCRPGSANQGVWCEVTYNIACTGTSTFSSAQTTCAAVNCAGACPCDWNHDGFVNGADLVAFLSDFLAGHGDFDHSGTTNNADYTAFVQCYSGAPTAQCIHR